MTYGERIRRGGGLIRKPVEKLSKHLIARSASGFDETAATGFAGGYDFSTSSRKTASQSKLPSAKPGISLQALQRLTLHSVRMALSSASE